MFNMRGEVIGIVCAIVSRSGGFEGLGFATPSNIARRVLLEEKLSWSGIDGFGPPGRRRPDSSWP